MKKHFCVVWDRDIGVSVIGDGIEQSYAQYLAYHSEAMNTNKGYLDFAIHFANWFLTRGFQVYVYPYEGGWRDVIYHKFFLWLGKKIGEVLPGIVVGRPKTEPETTLYV